MASSSCQLGENNASMPSNWVEDFLIEFYLEGSSYGDYTGEATELQTEHEETSCIDGELSAEVHVTVVETTTEPGIMEYTGEPQRQQAGIHLIESTECLEKVSSEDERMLEAWQAQYGQVVRSDGEAEACPRAINLWNWTTLVSKGKCKSKTSIHLVGQLTLTLSRLHRSLQHHNGFIKTSDVCEVNLDLVKVSSGEVFRLRQPSLEYLTSVALYDSTNPTNGWNFPCITFSGLEETAEHLETLECASSKMLGNSSITRPFVPNWNHQRFQQFKEMKVASPAIPAAVRALSGRERALADDRKRKYRDRANERRERYDNEKEELACKQEFSSIAKDTDDVIEEKPRRPLIGRQMLEKMGWSEGESIGKRKDGLIRPLDPAGNRGRAGIGWVSSNE